MAFRIKLKLLSMAEKLSSVITLCFSASFLCNLLLFPRWLSCPGASHCELLGKLLKVPTLSHASMWLGLLLLCPPTIDELPFMLSFI